MHKRLIAANLLAARRELGLTQEGVAAAIGASQDQVSKWERAVVTPSLPWQAKLAALFFEGDVGALYQQTKDAA